MIYHLWSMIWALEACFLVVSCFYISAKFPSASGAICLCQPTVRRIFFSSFGGRPTACDNKEPFSLWFQVALSISVLWQNFDHLLLWIHSNQACIHCRHRHTCLMNNLTCTCPCMRCYMQHSYQRIHGTTGWYRIPIFIVHCMATKGQASAKANGPSKPATEVVDVGTQLKIAQKELQWTTEQMDELYVPAHSYIIFLSWNL